MYELISTSNPIFYAMAFVWLVAMATLVLNNREGKAVGVLLGGLIVTQLFTDARPFNTLLDNWISVLLIALVYFAAGALWGVVKWYLFVRARAGKYADARTEILPRFLRKSTHQDLSTPAAQEDFRTYMRQQHSELLPPRVAHYRSMIMGWMIFWPISLVWSAVGDGVVFVFREIATRFGTLYHGIVRKAYGGFSEFND